MTNREHLMPTGPLAAADDDPDDIDRPDDAPTTPTNEPPPVPVEDPPPDATRTPPLTV